MCHSSIGETDFQDPCASPGLKEIISKAHARWEQQQRRRLPVLSAGTRELQALGWDAEIEAFKAAVRWNRQQADRAAPSKSRRLEDMSSRGARMLRMVLEQRSKQL
jgi:hypothetical protein